MACRSPQPLLSSTSATRPPTAAKAAAAPLYTDLTGGVKPFAQLSDTFTFAFDETESPLIQGLWFEDGTCRTAWRAPRPIPEDDDFFENVWRSYRETENVD